MSDHLEKIRMTVRELEVELHQLENVDDETRHILKEAMAEIHGALQDEEEMDLEAESLQDRLNNAARQFEGSHPTLSGLLYRLVNGLGQIGI